MLIYRRRRMRIHDKPASQWAGRPEAFEQVADEEIMDDENEDIEE